MSNKLSRSNMKRANVVNVPAWSIKDFAERIGISDRALRLRMSRSKIPAPNPIARGFKGSRGSETKLYTTFEFWAWWEADNAADQ